ncbi:MAG: RelA/SpoT family protein [Cyclobacteriaceae bacterium]|nr:RelA/SpoT family protein [Cyclobacteriaceae bacterium]
MIAIDLEVERKEIISRYRKLLRKSKPFLKSGDAKIIKKAFHLAADAHNNVRRKSGEPYIYHPLEVAQICVEEIGLGTTSIVSALLHDVVEDTEWTIDEIEQEFGNKVATIIDGLTKITGTFEYGSSHQAENFRKMLLTISQDLRVILIKLADRLHNMRTLDSMPRNKQLKIASETIYIYAPLAHRLGLYAIKSELEDLYLRYSERESYKEITKKISETSASRSRFISKFIKPIKDELTKQGLKFSIKGRPKSIHSIWNKMQKKDVPFEEVFDLFAVRIILETTPEREKADCWHIYSIVTDFYQPNPDRLRDWISTSKSNGYESLHTTVMSRTGQWVEVQIRSKRMDDIAEKGYAAHWKYKENDNMEESALEQWVGKVRDMLEQNDSPALEFIDEFRSNLFQDEVFVFTPKGDLRILPHDATALDFAFEIHSEIGVKCIGAKVNQKIVPINHRLNNGDQVEILTSNKQKANEDWLRFVVTSKARSNIKDELKSDKKHIADEGKELLLRKMKSLKIEPNNDTFDRMRRFLRVDTQFNLYYKIGTQGITTQLLRDFKEVKHARPVKINAMSGSLDAKTFEKKLKKAKGDDNDILLIGEDMDIVDYALSKCCNPIPGDDVFGFVTVSEGIKVHRTSCPNTTELMSNHGHRIIKAKWTSQQELSFATGLKIIGTDRVGLINDVTGIISSELKVNMRSLSIDTDHGIFEGSIKLYVNDTRHLDKLIAKLEQVEGVEKVNRFD